MRKSLFYALSAVFLLVVSFYAPREASAIPAFARQTGMSCNSCHYQHFPALNAFGRAFKAGGYTQGGGQSLIEGELLSLPTTLNASLMTKIRYQKRNGDSETGSAGELNKGEVQFPDEAALLFGGRAGEHIGFLLEASLLEGESLFASYKMPLVYDVAGVKLNFIPFSTEMNGAAYGFELLNTGALRMIRTIEHRTETSAQQYIGTDGMAMGFTFAAYQPTWFANYTLWSPERGNVAIGPYLDYARFAVTPTVAGWDLGTGVQWWGGTSKTGASADPMRQSADAWAVDAQSQGSLGALPVGVYLSYAVAKKSGTNEIANIFNSSTNKDKSAWSVLGEVGVIPNRLTLAAGYRAGKDGDPDGDGRDSDNATTLGAVYTVAQNLTFQLNHSWFTGDAKPAPSEGNQLTTLSLFAAF